MDLEASLETIFESLADERLLFIFENRYPIPKLEVLPILDNCKEENSVMCVLTLPLYIIILLLLLPQLPPPRLPPVQDRLPHVEDKNLRRRALFRNDDTKNVL